VGENIENISSGFRFKNHHISLFSFFYPPQSIQLASIFSQAPDLSDQVVHKVKSTAMLSIPRPQQVGCAASPIFASRSLDYVDFESVRMNTSCPRSTCSGLNNSTQDKTSFQDGVNRLRRRMKQRLRQRPQKEADSTSYNLHKAVGSCNGISETVCSICNEDLGKSYLDNLELPCGHVYHDDCIDYFVAGIHRQRRQ